MTMRPPEPFTSEVVRCPSCQHGIDPHGSDPGGPCGAGSASGERCECLWQPNDIAAALLERKDAAAGTAVGQVLAGIVLLGMVVVALGGLVWVARWTIGWAL